MVLKNGLEIMSTALPSIASLNKKYRSVALEQSCGNPMRDALDALFGEYALEQHYASLELSTVARENGNTTYSFKGTSISGSGPGDF